MSIKLMQLMLAQSSNVGVTVQMLFLRKLNSRGQVSRGVNLPQNL